MPHLLRASANPNQAYIDGRVADLLVVIEGMGAHLRMHEVEDWAKLNKQTLKIFEDRETKMRQRMEEFSRAQEEAAGK